MATANAKIFGLGLSKTGTTSLANALQILGYRTKDNMGVVKYATDDLSSVDLEVVDANDALTDTPIPSFYRALDARYPGSKFILTVRDSEGWRKLCPFLERPVPDVPFPKANVTQVRWMNVDDIVAIATHAGDELLRRYKGDRPVGSARSGNDGRSRTVRHLFERAMLTLRG